MFVVYCAKIDGGIVYIGSGKKGREKHCNSGCSHVYALNKAHFEGKDVVVEVMKDCCSKEEALEEEICAIKSLKPIYNKRFMEDITDNSLAKVQKCKNVRNVIDAIAKCVDIRKKSANPYSVAIKDFFKEVPIKYLMDGVGIKCNALVRKYKLTSAIARVTRPHYKLMFEIKEYNGVLHLVVRDALLAKITIEDFDSRRVAKEIIEESGMELNENQIKYLNRKQLPDSVRKWLNGDFD